MTMQIRFFLLAALMASHDMMLIRFGTAATAGTEHKHKHKMMKRFLPKEEKKHHVVANEEYEQHHHRVSMPSLAQEKVRQSRVMLHQHAKHKNHGKSEAKAKEVPGYPGIIDPQKVAAAEIAKNEYEDDWNREWKLGKPRQTTAAPEEEAPAVPEEKSAAVSSSRPLSLFLLLGLVLSKF